METIARLILIRMINYIVLKLNSKLGSLEQVFKEGPNFIKKEL